MVGCYNKFIIDMVDGVEVGEGLLNGNYEFSCFNFLVMVYYCMVDYYVYVFYS